VGKCEVKGHLEGVGADGRIILKLLCEKKMEFRGMD
jgi:hypothetical protein